MKYSYVSLMLIIVISLPAIALSNYAIVKESNEAISDSTHERLEAIVRSKENELDGYILDHQVLLSSISSTPGLVDDAWEVLSAFSHGTEAPGPMARLSEALNITTGVRARPMKLMLIEKSVGAIVACPYNEELVGYVPLNGTARLESVISPRLQYVANLPWTSLPVLFVTYPIQDGHGGVVGVMAALLELSELNEIFYGVEGVGRDGGAFLVASDGRLLTPSPRGLWVGEMTESEGARRSLDGGSGLVHTTTDSGVAVIQAYSGLEQWDLGLVVEMDAEEAEQSQNVVRFTASAAGLIVAGALVAIMVNVNRNLMRDLNSLVAWARKVSDGDWESALELGPTDEFQELERTLRQMVHDMLKQQTQIRLAESRYTNLFQSSLDPVFTCRPDGVIVELNKAGEIVLGLPRDDDGTYGYKLPELFATEEKRREFERLLGTQNAVAGYDVELELPSGRRLVVLVSATRRLDYSGRTVAFQGVLHDITDRVRFERALIQAKTQAEFYCDVMSHDLNNAVQGLGGYLELCNLARSLEDVNELIPAAQEQMARANDLLRNVRRLSRMDSLGVDLKRTDLRRSLERASRTVTAMHSRAEIELELEVPEGAVVAGEEFLEDAFVNLLDNAVKYDSHPVKRIELTAEEAEVEGSPRWRVRVSDRGPGVADRDKKTIFARFERKAIKEYGTGLGLSIVVKVAERCNGRVWVEDRVEGRPGEGATFVVELPAWRD